MNVEIIIKEAFNSGVALSVNGDDLVVEIKEGSLRPDLKHALVTNKRAIIQSLQESGLSSGPLSSHVKIPPHGLDTQIPLSFAQQRLWFMAQLDGDSGAYHLPESVRFKGELSIVALDAALATVVSRHESLRTHFYEEGGEVYQVIQPESVSGFDLLHLDLRALSAQEQSKRLEDEAHTERVMPFDLSAGPLIRGRLLRVLDDEYVLLVTMHHIVSDEWSMGVLINEINTLYESYREGRPNPLAPLTLQYADYAVWQRTHISGDALDEQGAYWQAHLVDVPALLSLPTDHPRPALQSYRGGRIEFVLTSDVSTRIKAVAASEGVTLFMVMFTAWTSLLSRLSGQDQVVVGTPVANRQRYEVEGLIGFFVNTLPLCADFSGSPSVKEALAQIKRMTLAGYTNQDVPFERVVALMQPERSLSYSPLFQAMFNLSLIHI